LRGEKVPEQQYIHREVLEAVLSSFNEGIHVIDTNGITIFYNSVAARNDGLDIEDVLGKPLLEVFPSLSNKSSTLLKVVHSGQAIAYKEQDYLNKRGVTIKTINATLPIFVAGNLIGAVEIAKNVSSLQMLSSITKRHVENIEHNGAVYTFANIITDNARVKQVIEQGKKAARSSSPILFFGESGTGKDLFARSIHNASLRRQAPFIAQTCAVLPDTLLDSLLFGTAKGSYSGAIDRQGLFELAHGGTLFLDELQSMPLALQSKLLRVLEDGLVRRIGSSKSTSVDIRLIAAINMHPQHALKANKLLTELYNRLNVMCYELPPLRERREDIGLLSSHFISIYNEKLGKRIKGIDDTAFPFFLQHLWPGNVRELKHTIEYMMNMAKNHFLSKDELPVILNQNATGHRQDIPLLPLRKAIVHTEQQLIREALAQTAGNVLQASKVLEIPRQTLQYKMKKLNLTEYV
jgi:arginine utilization regulatory protein